MAYRFGACILDTERRELRRGTALVAVEPQVFDLLVFLIRNRDRVVSKDDLIAGVWGGRIVSDSALTTRINAARSAIGDSGRAQALIRTWPRKGFRFVGAVGEDDGAPQPGDAAVVVRAEARAACVLIGEDEGAVRDVLRRGRDLVASGLENRGARLLTVQGDTVVAAFADAARAISASGAARAALADVNRSLPAAQRVHYRFAVAGGELADGPEGPCGTALERAAALATNAHPDAVRMSECVRAGLPADAQIQIVDAPAGGFELDDRGDAGPPAPLPAQLHALDLQLPNRPSIVLLPFRVAGDEREESEALAEGLRIDVQNALTKMAGIFLLGAGSANAMRGWSAAEAAGRSGVRYALEGIVQRAGARMRVSLQLVDAVAGAVAWSETYDRVLDGSFSLQDEITERIVTALNVRLGSGEQARIWHKCLTDPEARECFYRGVQAFMRMNRDSIASARVFFERLAVLAPDSPFGPTWMALCLWFESSRGWAADPAAAREQAGAWAERAVAMEDADGQAHTVLGNVRLLQRRFDEAIAVASQALEIRPGCSNANGFLANVLLYCGEPQQAAVHARRAIRFMPVYPPWFVEILAASYRDAGMADLAVIAAREALRIMPAGIQSRLLLTGALARCGWLADARRVAAEVREFDAALTLGRWSASQPYRDPGVLAAAAADLRRAGIPQ